MCKSTSKSVIFVAHRYSSVKQFKAAQQDYFQTKSQDARNVHSRCGDLRNRERGTGTGTIMHFTASVTYHKGSQSYLCQLHPWCQHVLQSLQTSSRQSIIQIFQTRYFWIFFVLVSYHSVVTFIHPEAVLGEIEYSRFLHFGFCERHFSQQTYRSVIFIFVRSICLRGLLCKPKWPKLSKKDYRCWFNRTLTHFRFMTVCF